MSGGFIANHAGFEPITFATSVRMLNQETLASNSGVKEGGWGDLADDSMLRLLLFNLMAAAFTRETDDQLKLF